MLKGFKEAYARYSTCSGNTGIIPLKVPAAQVGILPFLLRSSLWKAKETGWTLLGRREEKDGSRMPHMWPGSTLLRRNSPTFFIGWQGACLHGRTKVWQMVWTKQLSTRWWVDGKGSSALLCVEGFESYFASHGVWKFRFYIHLESKLFSPKLIKMTMTKASNQVETVVLSKDACTPRWVWSCRQIGHPSLESAWQVGWLPPHLLGGWKAAPIDISWVPTAVPWWN